MISRRLSLLGLGMALFFGSSILLAGKGGKKPPKDEDPVPVAPFSYEVRHVGFAGQDSRVDGMNNHGDVVGESGGGHVNGIIVNRNLGAFVYYADTDTTVSLNSLLVDEPDGTTSKWWVYNVSGINDEREISGNAIYDENGNGDLKDDVDRERRSVVFVPSEDQPGRYEIKFWGDNYGSSAINNYGDTIEVLDLENEKQVMLYQVGKGPVTIGLVGNIGRPEALSNRDGGGHVYVVGPTWIYNTATGLTFLPSYGRSNRITTAFDVSDIGVVVGTADVSRKDEFAAMYLEGEWLSLGTLATTQEWNDSCAHSISDNSEWVVGISLSGNVEDPINELGFLYDSNQAFMFDLNLMIAPGFPKLSQNLDRLKVNDEGWVCGDDQGEVFLLVPQTVSP